MQEKTTAGVVGVQRRPVRGSARPPHRSTTCSSAHVQGDGGPDLATFAEVGRERIDDGTEARVDLAVDDTPVHPARESRRSPSALE